MRGEVRENESLEIDNESIRMNHDETKGRDNAAFFSELLIFASRCPFSLSLFMSTSSFLHWLH